MLTLSPRDVILNELEFNYYQALGNNDTYLANVYLYEGEMIDWPADFSIFDDDYLTLLGLIDPVNQADFNLACSWCLQDLADILHHYDATPLWTDIDNALIINYDTLVYLCAQDYYYTDGFYIVEYLNHYTMDNAEDMLREFARDNYTNSELTTLVFDKMKWLCGDIQYNERKSVNPENYIPDKMYITTDADIAP